MGNVPAYRILLALVAALVLGGCSGTPSPGGAILRVGERDFHIGARASVTAGTVTIRDRNAGPERHELIVVRATSDRLPLRADGLTVDEDAIKRQTVGSVEDVAPGTTGEARLHLKPGRYLLFCNMAGHFRGGMHKVLEVS